MDAGVVTEQQSIHNGGATAEDLEELYRARLDVFVRVAAAITGDRDSARDAVHDAFAASLRDLAAFRREAALESWVWTAVVNSARNQRRGRRRRLRHEDPAATPEATATAVPPLDPEIRAMVAALPERQRLMLFLRYFADLDYATIGAVTGVSTGTVSATLSAAHSALRTAMETGGHR
ncbi:RNA polymerase sigma factor [Miltoncostaea oceani]|uniref:RNA polymerase sigma factor n=1 Tax=Miltoncostaea oceani TaxID=2843216 RepID=UPI001C3E0FE0|nr:sigma-70 family RNA polymerase sigma factor [Miltoncostaea oceani]